MRTFTSSLIVIILWMPSAFSLPEAGFTVRVVDEDGVPLQGARAVVVFEVPGVGQTGRKVSRGETNPEGVFSAAEPTTGYITCGADKDGYYSGYGVPYKFKTHGLGRWEPPNPIVEVVLRKVINPVPMYARKLVTRIPVIGRPVGFDLTAGDWIAPYGAGVISDFVFTLSRKGPNYNDFEATLRLTFSNDGDGIQSVLARPYEGSRLRLARNAPGTGYQGELLLKDWCHPGMGNYAQSREDQCYYFQVRTKGDTAVYGKIHGDIRFFAANPEKKPGLSFTYYLNPDGTRNIEFDPKRNLFKNLKTLEEVSEP